MDWKKEEKKQKFCNSFDRNFQIKAKNESFLMQKKRLPIIPRN